MGEVTECVLVVRPRADADVRDAAGQGAGRPGRLWARDGGDDARGARARRASSTASRKATARSTRPRSTSRSRTRWAASGRRPRSRSTALMLPERFDLHYIDEHGEQQRPVAIHRAIYGSLERFIGVLTEHFAGAFPFWCAPVQAVVIPIADRHIDAAERAGRRAARRGACASRSTTRPTGCRTRSGSPRSRRSRTCSSWATARSRPGRRRSGAATASRSRASRGPTLRRAWARRSGRSGCPEASGGEAPSGGGGIIAAMGPRR